MITSVSMWTMNKAGIDCVSQADNISVYV